MKRNIETYAEKVQIINSLAGKQLKFGSIFLDAKAKKAKVTYTDTGSYFVGDSISGEMYIPSIEDIKVMKYEENWLEGADYLTIEMATVTRDIEIAIVIREVK